MYPLYYVEVCNEFLKPISFSIYGKHNFYRENVAAVANRLLKHCIRFDQTKFESQTFRRRSEYVIARLAGGWASLYLTFV